MTARAPGKRRRKTTIEEDIPDIGTEETNEFDVSLEAAEDTETVNAVLEQFGIKDGVLFRIYRVTPTGQSFCYEAAELNEPFLQRERGEGTYAARLFINGKFKRSIPVLIEPLPNGNKPNGDSNGSYGHTAFLEKMLMALILKEHAPAPVVPQITLKDMTESLANLDNLRGKQESGMDMFIRGVEFFKGLGDGGPTDWKTELLKMGKDALPAITSIVQARAGIVPPVQQPTPENPNGGAPVQQIDPNNMTVEQRNILVKQGINFLKQQFMNGLTTDSALDFMVANAGNPGYAPVIRGLLGMTWEEIEGLDEELQRGKPFHVQFKSLFDGLRFEFTEQDTMDEHTGGNPGDHANPGNHGDTGKDGK